MSADLNMEQGLEIRNHKFSPFLGFYQKISIFLNGFAVIFFCPNPSPLEYMWM